MFRVLGSSFVAFLFLQIFTASADAQTQSLKQAMSAYNAGNYADAYNALREISLSTGLSGEDRGSAIKYAVQSLRQLGRLDESDKLLEDVFEHAGGQWQVLSALGSEYDSIDHQGYVIAGEFSRGWRRSGDRLVSSGERDRVRALELFLRALELCPDNVSKAEIWNNISTVIRRGNGSNEYWKLQALTNLSTLPDYDDYYHSYGYQGIGAPCDSNSLPLVFVVPPTFEKAMSDGERMQFAFSQIGKLNPDRVTEIEYRKAYLYKSLYDVQTIAAGARASVQNKETGTFAVHTLGDDETIAQLGCGLKRFSLENEINFIQIFKKYAEGPQSQAYYKEAALDELAGTMQDRRQYDRAADYWKRALSQFGDDQSKRRKKALDQILDPWGKLETLHAQAAGKEGVVNYRFRNGKKVTFELFQLKAENLSRDIVSYLKANAGERDERNTNLADIGYLVVSEKKNQYLGEKIATWSEGLTPRTGHFDTLASLPVRFSKSGVYLLKAKIEGGNESDIVVWINDAVIVLKSADRGALVYFADALSGAPIQDAEVHALGYKLEYVGTPRKPYNILTTELSVKTDAQGIASFSSAQGYSWLVTAKSADGRNAMLGAPVSWGVPFWSPNYDQTKAFFITDRPVYRPEQRVKFKAWIGEAKYDSGSDSRFAEKNFTVRITAPQGEIFLEKEYRTDGFGGLDGEVSLPKKAKLGIYQIAILNDSISGNGTFRVEEYKKPEFEVNVDAPKDQVSLGNEIEIPVSARYYFGSPVQHAKAKYKVLRTTFTDTWYPFDCWDWLYGNGYWWFGPGRRISYEALNYKMRGEWWPVRNAQPEVVAQGELVLDNSGEAEIKIDTRPAKELHGDTDHKYQIEVEVTDESRRTIAGSGEVIVAREPVKIHIWTEKGYYHSGDQIKSQFQVRRLDKKSVTGRGKAKLTQLFHEDGGAEGVKESVVQEWPLELNEEGSGTLQLTAAREGQYKLSFSLEGSSVEGNYVFSVLGKDNVAPSFKFEDIQITPDKRNYKAGETANLLVTTNRKKSTVLLFSRPVNGVYSRPQVLVLSAKSTVQGEKIGLGDMPNFFVEAVTVSAGEVYTDLREIAVPPEEKSLDVEVKPSSTEYRPGTEAKVDVTVKDVTGKPVSGSIAIAVYDKSVEYISGGTSIPDIREYFWKWRRSHSIRGESNAELVFSELAADSSKQMLPIGALGATVAEDEVLQKNKAPESLRKKSRMAEFAETKAEGLGGSAVPLAMEAPVDKEADEKAPGSPQSVAVTEPHVRSQFADTAYWNVNIITDANGNGSIKFPLPENLTSWKIRTWAMSAGTRVGEESAVVTTKKDVIVRLQSPRFLVQNDEVILSANIHNYLSSAKNIQAKLEIDSKLAELLSPASQQIDIAASNEKRIDWKVKVKREGDLKIRMFAITDAESDAVEATIPLYIHGAQKMETFTGSIREGQGVKAIEFTIPEKRREAETSFQLRYSPTLAMAIIDALPYLNDYPYGCTEQTLNRFLPTAITQKLLRDLKLDLKQIRDKRVNFNAQELGAASDRAGDWRRGNRDAVFDDDKVAAMAEEGFNRLAQMQLPDGGWSWFYGAHTEASSHITALTVRGLLAAKQAGYKDADKLIAPAVLWLKRYQSHELARLKAWKGVSGMETKEKADNLDAFVYLVLSEAAQGTSPIKEILYRDRTQLAVYAKVLFALAMKNENDKEKLEMLLQNIRQYLVLDNENETAYLKLPVSESWYYWYGSEIEAISFYLKLLTRVDANGEIAPRLVKYLLTNRKHSSYWNSTRDTALAVEAIADYISTTQENKPDLTLHVIADGKKIKTVTITPDNIFAFDDTVVIPASQLGAGKHRIELHREGKGPVYYSAYLSYFTTEDFITKAGLDLKVDRRYYKLEPEDKKALAAGAAGEAIQQKVEKFKRVPLKDLEEVASGDLVEAELEIEGKNDYEYLIFEDMKPAGFEPLEVRSGYNGNDINAYIEYRDDRVAMFASQLARGKHSVSYRLRAETPGRFSALPAQASAMYAPELRGNSDEIRLKVRD